MKRPFRCLLAALLLDLALISGAGEEGSNKAATTSTTNSFSIPIHLSHERVIIPARVNGSEPMQFLLDSACTIPTLHPGLARDLGLVSSGHVRINGIAGEERAPTFRDVVFDLGPAQYSPRRVASIPSEEHESRRRRDGVIGSGFFNQYVVEVNVRKKLMILHSPLGYEADPAATIVPFQFREEIPVVKAAIKMEGRPEIMNEFEVDTGCDSGLCLGRDFVEQNRLLDSDAGKGSQKFGIGGSAQTRSGEVRALYLGDKTFSNVQTDFFLEGSPVEKPLAGHIGMAALSQKIVIFDYSRKRLLLKDY